MSAGKAYISGKRGIGQLKNGKQGFTVEHLRNMAKVFGVNLNWITGLDSEMMRKPGRSPMQQLKDAVASLQAAQERYLLHPDIDEKIYKKAIAGLKADEARLQQQVSELSSSSGQWYSVLNDLLPRLSNVKELFDALPLVRKTAFIKAVFGNSLWYENKSFRTPELHPLFAHKELELKEKGLLIIQQPVNFSGITPDRRVTGNWLEHMTELWQIVA